VLGSSPVTPFSVPQARLLLFSWIASSLQSPCAEAMPSIDPKCFLLDQAIALPKRGQILRQLKHSNLFLSTTCGGTSSPPGVGDWRRVYPTACHKGKEQIFAPKRDSEYGYCQPFFSFTHTEEFHGKEPYCSARRAKSWSNRNPHGTAGINMHPKNVGERDT